MPRTEGNLWLTASIFFTNNVYGEISGFFILFAYSHLGFVWGFLFVWGFYWLGFFTGLISSYSVIIKERRQNNFIHEMGKSYFNV